MPSAALPNERPGVRLQLEHLVTKADLNGCELRLPAGSWGCICRKFVLPKMSACLELEAAEASASCSTILRKDTAGVALSACVAGAVSGLRQRAEMFSGHV